MRNVRAYANSQSTLIYQLYPRSDMSGRDNVQGKPQCVSEF
jgi:hypothetical protein